MMRVLSLGAGVQSSTLLLMAARGEIRTLSPEAEAYLAHRGGERDPVQEAREYGVPTAPDAAIFADTGWEPARVYEWLDFLEEQVRGVIPIHRVSIGDIRADVLGGAKRNGQPPFFVLSNGEAGREAMIRRQCTQAYKIEPITKRIRELVAERMMATEPESVPDALRAALEAAGYEAVKGWRMPAAASVEQWMGISLDEVTRMKPSRVRWIRNRYPLVDMRMSRRDCLSWLERRGFPEAPRSACKGCPYHTDGEWRRMQREDPDSWTDAVDFDRSLREIGVRGIVGELYLHRSLRPLDEVDLSTAEERGQGHLFDGFAEECEGMCGV